MKIAPSILAADFSKLALEIKDVESGGADYIHIDVMDGHFVPNITMGPIVVDAIKQITNLPLDVHLMITQPDRYIETFAKAGADIITIHAEADPHLHRTIHEIKKLGVRAGVAINPSTPISMIQHVIYDIDLVLLMTVNPGFGGQKFIPHVLEKITETKNLVEKNNLHVEIEVDGGINGHTAKLCKEAGANVFVAGSAIFGSKNRKEAIEEIRAQLGD